jgi:hypothetical protein
MTKEQTNELHRKWRMIFEFNEIEQAEAFAVEVKKSFGIDSLVFDDAEAAGHAFPREQPGRAYRPPPVEIGMGCCVRSRSSYRENGRGIRRDLREKTMSNQYVEQFAKLSPENQEREQADELQRLQSGDMSETEWFERASAWREIGRPDFDEAALLEKWQRVHQRTENLKRKPWDR